MTTILAANGDLQIHLRARCATVGEADALLAEVGGPIELLLGDRIYSRNGDPLEVVVGDMLRKLHATVAVAESATGGLLGDRFSSVPGSSEYFLGGLITYTKAMKMELLGVPPEILEEFGAVSKETAEAMATGARAAPMRPMRSPSRGLPAPIPEAKRCPSARFLWESPTPPETT